MAKSCSSTNLGDMETLTQEFSLLIRDCWKKLKEHSRFYRMIEDGKATAVHVSRLLTSTKYLIQHTPIHLKIAVSLAENLKHFPDLKTYFLEHMETEVNHHKWADDDLENLQIISPYVEEEVSVKMVDFVRGIGELINKDVILLLPYIYWAEYMCVVATPELSEQISSKCSIPKNCLSVFVKHAILDADHAVDDLDMLYKAIKMDAGYDAKFKETIILTNNRYLEFWEAIAK